MATSGSGIRIRFRGMDRVMVGGWLYPCISVTLSSARGYAFLPLR